MATEPKKPVVLDPQRQLKIIKLMGMGPMQTAAIFKIQHGIADFAGQLITCVIDGDLCKKETCVWCDRLREWMRKWRKA